MRFLTALAFCIMLVMPAVHASYVSENKWGQLNNTHINTLTITEPDLAFREVNLNVKSTMSGVWVTFTRNDNRPYTVAENAGENVYQYIETELTNLYNPNIKNGTIKFAVSASWFADRGTDPDNVTLRWYDNYVWKSLPTRKLSNGLYEADITGLDVFAIVAQNATATSTTATTTTALVTTTTQTAVTTTTIAEQKDQSILPIAVGILAVAAAVFAVIIVRKKGFRNT